LGSKESAHRTIFGHCSNLIYIYTYIHIYIYTYIYIYIFDHCSNLIRRNGEAARREGGRERGREREGGREREREGEGGREGGRERERVCLWLSISGHCVCARADTIIFIILIIISHLTICSLAYRLVARLRKAIDRFICIPGSLFHVQTRTFMRTRARKHKHTTCKVTHIHERARAQMHTHTHTHTQTLSLSLSLFLSLARSLSLFLSLGKGGGRRGGAGRTRRRNAGTNFVFVRCPNAWTRPRWIRACTQSESLLNSLIEMTAILGNIPLSSYRRQKSRI